MFILTIRSAKKHIVLKYFRIYYKSEKSYKSYQKVIDLVNNAND